MSQVCMRRIRVVVGVLVLGSVAVLAAGCAKKKKEPTYADGLVRAMQEGKASGARGDLQAIAIAITTLVGNEGNIPDASNIDELAAKLEPTYLHRVQRIDPWGTPYGYSQDGSGYKLKCAGKDKTFGNEDDMEITDGQVTKMPASYQQFK